MANYDYQSWGLCEWARKAPLIHHSKASAYIIFVLENTNI